MRTDRRSLELPGEVVERIESRLPYTEFDAVDDYVVHVLEEVLHAVERENDLSTAEAVDERQVEERLKSLGYLNE